MLWLPHDAAVVEDELWKLALPAIGADATRQDRATDRGPVCELPTWLSRFGKNRCTPARRLSLQFAERFASNAEEPVNPPRPSPGRCVQYRPW